MKDFDKYRRRAALINTARGAAAGSLGALLTGALIRMHDKTAPKKLVPTAAAIGALIGAVSGGGTTYGGLSLRRALDKRREHTKGQGIDEEGRAIHPYGGLPQKIDEFVTGVEFAPPPRKKGTEKG
jgi:hypothetical protein